MLVLYYFIKWGYIFDIDVYGLEDWGVLHLEYILLWRKSWGFWIFFGGRNEVGRLGSYKQFIWNMRKGDNLVFDCFIQRWTSKLLKFLFDYI